MSAHQSLQVYMSGMVTVIQCVLSFIICPRPRRSVKTPAQTAERRPKRASTHWRRFGGLNLCQSASCSRQKQPSMEVLRKQALLSLQRGVQGDSMFSTPLLIIRRKIPLKQKASTVSSYGKFVFRLLPEQVLTPPSCEINILPIRKFTLWLTAF